MLKFFGIGEDGELKDLTSDLSEKNDSEDSVSQIALDIIENDYEIILVAPIAGIDLEDIDITYKDSVLTISGYREKPSIYSGEVILRNSECYWGKFVRNIILPENLDFEDINASMENNLLTITIKKLQFSSRNIKINRIEG